MQYKLKLLADDLDHSCGKTIVKINANFIAKVDPQKKPRVNVSGEKHTKYNILYSQLSSKFH